MMMSNRKHNFSQIFVLSLLSFLLTGCGFQFITVADVPTPATNLPDLVKNISNSDPTTRLVSMEALKKYGDAGVVAIPNLTENLYYKNAQSIDVQVAAAEALGRFGHKAKSAVTDLETVLQDPNSGLEVREAICDSLGEIGDPRSIPIIVDALYNDDTQSYKIAAACANSIAKITHEPFRDTSPENITGYATDESGVPFIVIDAQKWWEEKGKYLDWNN